VKIPLFGCFSYSAIGAMGSTGQDAVITDKVLGFKIFIVILENVESKNI